MVVMGRGEIRFTGEDAGRISILKLLKTGMRFYSQGETFLKYSFGCRTRKYWGNSTNHCEQVIYENKTVVQEKNQRRGTEPESFHASIRKEEKVGSERFVKSIKSVFLDVGIPRLSYFLVLSCSMVLWCSEPSLSLSLSFDCKQGKKSPRFYYSILFYFLTVNR